MCTYKTLLIASLIGLSFQNFHAQNQFAKIEKNHNIIAKDLTHELNATKDTLLLQSPKTIDYVYAINSEYKRELDFYNNTSSLKIPLKQLSKGKHVFVVGNQRMQIIFVVRILSDNKAFAMTTKSKMTATHN